MYDLKNLERWIPVKAGLKFPNDEPRKVRLEVLSPEEDSLLYVTQAKGPKFCIGRFFRSYEVVQFAVNGAWSLTASGGNVLIWTPETVDAGIVKLPDAVSFTTIMTRRQRNPELELLMKKVGDNMERRIAQVQHDVSLVIARERREHAAEIEAERQRVASEQAAQDAAAGAAAAAAQSAPPSAPAQS